MSPFVRLLFLVTALVDVVIAVGTWLGYMSELDRALQGALWFTIALFLVGLALEEGQR